MKRLLLLSVAFSVAFTGAFFVRRVLIQDETRAVSRETDVHTRSSLLGNRKPASRPVRHESIEGLKALSSSTAQIVAAFEMGKVTDDPAEIRRLLLQCKTLPHVTENIAHDALIDKFLDVDPQGAIRFLLSGNRFIGDHMKIWMRQDPDAAMAFARSSPHSEPMKHCLAVLAETNPEGGFEVMLTENLVSSEVLQAYVQQDWEAALERSENLSGQVRESIRNIAVETWAKTDLVSALDWAAKQPDAKGLLGRSFFSELPPYSWDAVARTFNGMEEAKAAPLWSNFKSGLRKDPVSAIEFLARHPELEETFSEYERARLYGDLAYKDPKHAMEYLDEFDKPERKAQLANNIIYGLRNEDSQAAEDWKKTLDPEILAHMNPSGPEPKRPTFKPTTSAELVNWIAEGSSFYGRLDLQIRQGLPEAVVAHAEPTGILDSLSSAYSEEYPELILDITAHIAAAEEELPGSLERSFAKSLRDVALNDPSGAARRAEALPPGKLRTTAVRNVVLQWKRFDPATARLWAESLSAGDREAAVQMLE